ncbi:MULTISPECIES: class I SAM-dependent methyltransferase [Bradyrhizobium]|uniref:class I SAM-dependent methyltransferase n=1 Tax=Bradyrhizobium TaxID=374 RepID=UPI001596D490|nr:methyltransferase [Bradyrhizobium septentrionale]UGY22042.1 class I SAM-dependent methyltransferase [Bradyrhizobium septentrionale]
MVDKIAGWVATLAGDNLDEVVRDYDWICNLVLEEELHFRRNGSYRLKTFADAVAQVYSNDKLMEHYMNGLLMTQVWWSNHTEAMTFYIDRFLGQFDQSFDHLEIGPGHGLLLYLAASEPLCRRIEAWDVSAESIDKTRHAMARLGAVRDVALRVQDIFATPPESSRFDSIALSEVLEHLEHPRDALVQLRKLLAPGGRLYVNMPINSPAPDHLFLLPTPEDVVEFIAGCGYRVVDTHFAPQTNMTIERARKTKSTITTVVVATPAD